jgi:hypothetical protein
VDQQDPAGPAEASWLKHPFARTFDLLSAEYGWTDDQILDLTLTRMRQCREICFQRLAERRDWEIDLAEAVTKQLVMHVRAAAGDRRASKAANKVRLFKRQSDNEAKFEQIARAMGGTPGLNEIDPELVAAAYGPRKAAT